MKNNKNKNMKKVFISGAGSGIGKACTQLFIEKGWFVFAVDINSESLLYLDEFQDQTQTATLDVTNVEQVQKIFAEVDSRCQNQLDLIVNNAGVLQMGTFENIALENHQLTVQVNLQGVINCTYAALPLLKKTKDARIINISSSSAAYGVPEFSVYAATKGAVSSLTESWNIEFAKYGIYVCDIRPLFVNTPLLESDYKAKSLRTMGIQLTPEQVAKTVWEATHKNKLHWSIGFQHHAMNAALAFMPFAKHRIFSGLMSK